jgi:hypothetical protein
MIALGHRYTLHHTNGISTVQNCTYLQWGIITLPYPLNACKCIPSSSSSFFFFSFSFSPSPLTTSYTSFNKSSKSSSSQLPPGRLLSTIVLFVSSCSLTAPNSSLSCSSVTFARSCPVRASVMRRFSMSVARDSLTRRMRPRRSRAGGVRIWCRSEVRWAAVGGGGG